ncbi:hypothetical protein Y697_08985 [Mesotoga sp. BH458_6_3_2_1]|nr:hypothetical protein Y697_08985 [Mesotoga sp. BH458_6_3_2_1]
MLVLHDFNQEQRKDPRSGTKNRFLIWGTENRPTVIRFSVALSNHQPATPNAGFSKDQIPKQVRDDN